MYCESHVQFLATFNIPFSSISEAFFKYLIQPQSQPHTPPPPPAGVDCASANNSFVKEDGEWRRVQKSGGRGYH